MRREKQIAAGKRGGRSQAAGAGESGRRKRVRREKRIAAGERGGAHRLQVRGRAGGGKE